MPKPTSACRANFYLWVLLAALIVVCFRPASAQETRGGFGGSTLDRSGAAVPKATVTATNVATNVSVSTTSDAQGNYVIAFLLPGAYTLSARAVGFKTAQTGNIELRIHDRLQIDLSLDVGDITEKVQVTGQSPLLETANANLGQVIESRMISELPTPHGSPITLIYLTPGVVNTYPGGMGYQDPLNLNATTTRTNISGAPLGTTDWTVDGVPNTQTSNADFGVGMSNSPPADIVEEFKLETAFDASFGHTSGTVVNLIFKSGTNQFHGSGYYFRRQPNWDANDFFANAAKQPRADFYYDRWGGSFLGPVYIPKVYNGRNRTFYSFGYEQMRVTYPDPFVSTVPTPAELTGDFSKLLALGSQYQIYDPATIKPAANGRFSIDPFPGNILPANRINSISQAIAKHYPQPNVAGRADDTNNLSVQNRPDKATFFNYIGRVDHSISDKHRFYARVSISRKLDGPYRDYTDDVAYSNTYIGKTRQLAADDVYTFSPSFLMDIRYGYSRYAGGHQPRRVGFDATQLGFAPPVVGNLTLTDKLFPCVQTMGMANVGCEAHDVLNNDIHTLFVSFTKQYHRHNLKFGTDLRAYRDNDFKFGNAGGNFSFNTAYTQGPLDNSPSSPGGIGQGLAAFLLGLPSSNSSVDLNTAQSIQSTYWAFYLHDNWRVNQKLTLDFGMRWEYEGPVTERFNRAVRGFNPSAQLSITAAAQAQYAANPDPALPASQFKVQGGLLYANVGGVPRLFWDRSLGHFPGNFAPRLGFAYRVTNKIVFRGGFGVFPIEIGQPAQNRALLTGFSQTTNLVPTLDNGQTFTATLSNPFPTGVLRPTGSSLGASTFLGKAISFYNPIDRTPYNMAWSFNTQFLLPGEVLLETGYRGSKAIDLFVNRNVNGLPNQYLSTSPVRDQATINYLTTNVPNPFAGLLPGTSLNSGAIARNLLLLPYPQFAGVTMQDFQGYSWYHSLQVRLERRFSKGFTILAAYAFSKELDATSYLNPADPLPYRSISVSDRPHNLAVSGIYELPIGRGKFFARDAHRMVNAIIGGWQTGAVFHYNSGQPLGFGNALFNGNVKDIALPRDQRTIAHWFNTSGFVTASSQQLAFNLVTFPILFSGVRAAPSNQWDISLLKNTAIWERCRLQFRAEALNALNHPNFATPNTSPTSAAFGTVTSAYGTPRILQLGIKVIF